MIFFRSGIVALAVAGAFVVAGCRFYDYQLRVHNGTTQTLLIRVNPHLTADGGKDAGIRYVREIEPGGEGVPVQWYGAPDNAIELLEPDCNVLGILHSQDGVTYSVTGI